MRRSAGRYDFVIAGGGTAGCVLAARLSEDPTASVLLIEAGPPDRSIWTRIPIGFARLTDSGYEWGYRTRPQEHCEGREIPLAQGKIVGGGGSINAQVFTRGTPADYDGWARQFGATGWSFAEVQPYFLRSEDNERLSAPWHGTGGPLGVSDLKDPHPLTRAWVKGVQEFGLPYNGDFNGATQYGVGYYQTTTRNGQRCSASQGYLRPARKRRNLSVVTGQSVTRIVLDGKRAVAVEAISDGETHRYRAEREVIVAGGAIGSPKLLQLSGIGDPDHLRSVGVEVRHALPGVGRNLHDHCDLDIVYELNEYQSLDRLARMRPYTAGAGLEYILWKRGPLTSTLVEGGAFSCTQEDPAAPDLQFHFLPAAGVEAGIAKLKPGYGCTLNSYFLHPSSRGSVLIASADPSAAPAIDPNYVADEQDLERSAEGLRQMQAMMGQPSMAPLIKRAMLAGGHTLETLDDRIRYVREHGRTAYHPVGTCAMGDRDDAVVSAELRVHGLEGLRVADASVMPRIVSSNTQAPTVMIAEKAADMVLGRPALSPLASPVRAQPARASGAH